MNFAFICLCLCLHRLLMVMQVSSASNAMDRLNVSGQQTTWRWTVADNTTGQFSPIYLNVSTNAVPLMTKVVTTGLTTTTFPSIEETLDVTESDTTPVINGGNSELLTDNRRHSPYNVPITGTEPAEEPPVVKRESWFQKVKDFFRPPPKPQPTDQESFFTEKYGSGVGGPHYPQPSAHIPLYQGYFSGGGGGGGGYNYGAHPHPLMHPDGGYAPVFKPQVSLSLTADFIELNCAAHGRIQQGIRWVKLVQGLNSYGHQLFATVADGERILFDTYHFGVRTDGRNSRLIIRNPDPKTHYGVYQCQVSVAGNPSLIVKQEFVVGKIM